MVNKDKVKPYILNVAEIIYLAIFDIKKNNPKLTNIEAIELFIGSEKYNKIPNNTVVQPIILRDLKSFMIPDWAIR